MKTPKFLIKIKKFLYLIFQLVISAKKRAFGYIGLIHKRLSSLDTETGTIPYLEFYEWIVEILTYGLISAFVYFNLFMLSSWIKWALLPISLGLIRWLWLDLIEKTSTAMKGNK
jgi:hypothetical protein